VGLTDDQKAMLRLLAQREEGYDDMAALMGISVEEVRARVKEALAEVEEPEAPGPERETPAPVPPAVEPAPPPPPATQVTPEPPKVPASPPEPAEAAAPVPAPGDAVPAAGPKRSAQVPSLKLPKDRGALVGLGAGALVVVIFIVVLIAGGDGGGSSSTSTPAESNSTENASAAAESKNLTQAVLSPTDGGDASGQAIFGRYRKKILLQVTAEGLEQLEKGQMYTVWLYRSPKIALQIGASPVDGAGKLAAQFEIPAQLLTYVANGAFDQIDLARTDTAEYKAAFAKAKRESKVPPYVGESVLRGTITSPAIR
jgi:outer membrane biosynthesis protein TonB